MTPALSFSSSCNCSSRSRGNGASGNEIGDHQNDHSTRARSTTVLRRFILRVAGNGGSLLRVSRSVKVAQHQRGVREKRQPGCCPVWLGLARPRLPRSALISLLRRLKLKVRGRRGQRRGGVSISAGQICHRLGAITKSHHQHSTCASSFDI